MYALTLILLLLVLGWLLGPAGLLGLLVLLAVLTIIVAACAASPRPADMRIGIGRRMLCWLREIAAALAIILVTMPLERLIMRRDVAARRQDAWPVLLVHGYINNAGALWTLWHELVAQGYGVHTINLEPTYTSIENYVAPIAARIADIRARSGAAKVVLVSHSMGGLAARAYLRRVPDAPLAQLIMLGAPHHGTVLAYTAAGRNGAQMRPGNAWLAQLAADEKAAWPCPVSSVFSYDDNIVAPQESARLDGARNIALAGIGHMAMPMSRSLARRVAAVIVPQPRPTGSPE